MPLFTDLLQVALWSPIPSSCDSVGVGPTAPEPCGWLFLGILLSVGPLDVDMYELEVSLHVAYGCAVVTARDQAVYWTVPF